MKDAGRPASASSPGGQAPRSPGLSKGALRVTGLARDVAADLADGYRKSDRFTKMRMGVVGAWAVLSLLTLWLACPGGRGPSNGLGAEVQVSAELLGTQVLVSNSSGRMWTDVTLTLDDTWRWQTPTLRQGQRVVIAASRFSKDGAAAPHDLSPRKLSIRCAQGSVILPLPARPP